MPSYPVDTYQGKPLEKSHTVRSVISCPTHLGFPSKRERFFGAAINKKTLLWLGPSQDEVGKDFDKFCGRSCELSGRAYLQAPPAEIHNMVQIIAHGRKTSLPHFYKGNKKTAASMIDVLPKLLPPGACSRVGDYERQRRETRGTGTDSAYFVDLDHNPGKGPTAGAHWPCMLTHNSIYSFPDERLVTEGECFSAMGVDWYPRLSGTRACSQLKDHLQMLSRADQRFLAGNSIHIPSAMAWMLYIWCNCAFRSDFECIPAVLAEAKQLCDEAHDDADVERDTLGSKSKRMRIAGPL